MSPYVRTVRTASGARAVQIVHSSRKGARSIEHIGSAHDDAELRRSRRSPGNGSTPASSASTCRA